MSLNKDDTASPFFLFAEQLREHVLNEHGAYDASAARAVELAIAFYTEFNPPSLPSQGVGISNDGKGATNGI